MTDYIMNLILFCDNLLIYDTKTDLKDDLVRGLCLSKGQKNEKKIRKTDKNTGLSRSSSPEEDAQDVGYEQHQAHSGGEALAVAAPLDVLVLWHIGQDSPKHHDAGRQPGQQRPRALHVLLLQAHLCIHHTGRSSGGSRGSKGCTWATVK